MFSPALTLQLQPCLLNNSLKGLVRVVDPARVDQVSAS